MDKIVAKAELLLKKKSEEEGNSKRAYYGFTEPK